MWIQAHAFANCESLKSLIIPGNCTEIMYKAFESCKNLTEVTFLDPVSYIKSDSRSDKQIDGFLVRYINTSAFDDCPSLANITLPKKHYICTTSYQVGDGKVPFDPSTWESLKNVKITYKISTNNPFENSENFTPHITKGEMDILTDSFEYNDGTTVCGLTIIGSTGVQNKDQSDSWEAVCISNSLMKEFIQKGDNISFRAFGDGNDWVIHFILYDDDKPIDYTYKFSTKRADWMTVKIPYKKLKPTDKSVKHKFKKEEVCDVIISGNNPGQETKRYLNIYNVKVY